MPYIKLENFSGTVPRTGPTLLDGTQAQVAKNVKLQSRELRSWKKPVAAYAPSVANIQTIYKMEGAGGAFRWATWPTDVDVVPGPVADTSDFRIYYTGDGVPKKTNYAMATSGGVDPYPNTWLNMGVPNPTGAPTLTPSSTTGTVETRAYVYTYVSTFGSVKEESGPSPATTVTVTNTGASVTVAGFSAAPTANYNITSIRIYRSVAGTSSTVYSFVTEIPITTTSYVDSLSVTQLGNTLPSLYYVPPPSGLTGLVAMPNGILAGFVNNQIYFCEPYLPHAWPTQYMLSVDYPIVGLGVYDTTLVVMTNKRTYLITGSSPGAMSQTKLPMIQPCISKRSIATDQYGVLYASPNGLVSIGSLTQDIISTPLYTRDEWQTLTPSSMLGVIYNNLYIFFHNTTTGISAGVLARGDTPPLSDLSFDATSVFVDRSTGGVYATSQYDNKIYQLDSDTVNNTVYEWTSKKFVMPNPMNFGVFKIQADYGYMNDVSAYNASVATIAAANLALYTSLTGKSLGGNMNDNQLNGMLLNGSLLTGSPAAADLRNIQAIIYGDGVQVYSTGVTSQEPYRLPMSTKAYVWEVTLTGNVPVRSFIMATGVGEMRTING